MTDEMQLVIGQYVGAIGVTPFTLNKAVEMRSRGWY